MTWKKVGAYGESYPLAKLLAIAVVAKFAGYHRVTAFAEFVKESTYHQLRAFYSHRPVRFTAHSATAFFKV